MPDPPDPEEQQSEQAKNDSPTNHSELLGNRRKDEVTLLHWDEFAIGQRGIEVPLAEPAASGHRTLGITNLEDITLKVFVR